MGRIIREEGAGLGLSLQGTVRVVARRELQARHYVRALAPRGPVASTGLFSQGDELLEVTTAPTLAHGRCALAAGHVFIHRLFIYRVVSQVNGWRVLGAHHVEVVSRLRTASSPTTLVAVRTRKDRDPPRINVI